jgi:helix-turn-helix protein
MGDEQGILKELQELKAMVAQLVDKELVKEHYDVEEFARLVGKAAFTVREWCRHGRIHAAKRRSGRGAYPAWVISRAEFLRYQKEGLIPLATVSTRFA